MSLVKGVWYAIAYVNKFYNPSPVLREFMEAQREYLQKKKEREEVGAASVEAEEVKMKEKVAKLIKMRRLAKMAKVLDSSTVRSITLVVRAQAIYLMLCW